MNKQTTAALLALIATSALALSACGKKESGGSTGPATGTAAGPIDMAAGKKLYDERCAPCHGTSGKGDGAAAAALNPKPRNYSDKAWQASVTDEQIKKAIIYGGAAIGKSPIMPSSPDLDSKPEVVNALVKQVRDFGK